MLTIDYRADDFPSGSPPHLIGGGSLTVTWHDIIWAAVSVGKNGLFDVFAHGPFSQDEMMFRAYMVYANLQQVGGNIYRSPAYDGLDRSEKGAISFFFGMTFAKLAAGFLLDTPWLVHLAKVKPVVLAGRSRPDLIGITSSGDWLVVEAKGRTNRYSPQVMNTAKAQSQQVRSIRGARPNLRVATQSYFSNCLELVLLDPDGEEGEHDLSITADEFLTSYYEPFARWDRTRGRLIDDDQTYTFVDFENLDVSIGIRSELIRAPADIIRQTKFERRTLAENGAAGSGLALFPDGLAVQLGTRWSEESMSKPPEARG